MKEESKENKILCIRCGQDARDSGVPKLCKKCAREMEVLTNRLGEPEVRMWFMENRSKDYILRKLRERSLKLLREIHEIEREKYSKWLKKRKSN